MNDARHMSEKHLVSASNFFKNYIGNRPVFVNRLVLYYYLNQGTHINKNPARHTIAIYGDKLFSLTFILGAASQ